jgi:hypothetical protein
MKRVLLGLSAVTSLFSLPGHASTGVPDFDGQYPAVGAFYELSVSADGTVDWAEESCTATLISSRLAITAAHCTSYYLENVGLAGYSDQAWVSFDVIASRNDFHCFLRQNGLDGGVAGPSDNGPDDQLPCSQDAAGNPVENEPGVPPHPRPTFRRVVPSGYFDGVPITIGVSHPGYLEDHAQPNGTISRRGNQLGNLPDLAVLYLESPVTAIAPLPLPPLNYLNSLSGLGQVEMTGVGYGLNWAKVPGSHPTQGSGPLQIDGGSGIRRIAALGDVQNLHQHSITPSQHANQGDDTVCYGDSGSPAFLDADHDGQVEPVITGILSGWTNWCQGSRDPYSRVDTALARGFLSCVLSATSHSAVRACGAEASIEDLCATASCP